MSPPYAAEAERYVLGAMLWDRSAVGQAIGYLAPEDFAPEHRFIFQALRNLYLDGDPIAPLIVMDKLRREGWVKTGEESNELIRLLNDAGSSLYLRQHCQLILQRSHARALREVVADPQTMTTSEIEEATERAEFLLLRLRQGEQEPPRSVGESIGKDLEAIEDAAKTKRALMGIPTGFETLDEMTSGFGPGHLVVVGAETGFGKTSVMLRSAVTAAVAGARVLFFTLEMTALEIRQRIYAQISGLPLFAIRTGRLNEGDWERLNDIVSQVQKWSFVICDRRGVGSREIAAEARRVSADRDGVDLVVVDYLQFMKPTDRSVMRYEQVGQMARDLKELAGQLGCTIMTGAQLSRAPAGRTDKRPIKSDLRESGDIENSADLILLLHQPSRYDPKAAGDRGDLIVAKHRQGEANKIIPIRNDWERTLMFERAVV